MSLHTKHPLVRELMKHEGQAEIIDGSIVEFPLAGAMAGHAADRIKFSLHAYADITDNGRVGASTLAFLSDLPSLRSFCANASYYLSPEGGEKFDPIPYPPLFAVEVRLPHEYGLKAERAMRDKRADYFAAGTLVVWDVDLDGELEVIAKYVASDPHNPQFFGKSDEADAEPAVAGWKMKVSALFAPTRAQ